MAERIASVNDLFSGSTRAGSYWHASTASRSVASIASEALDVGAIVDGAASICMHVV